MKNCRSGKAENRTGDSLPQIYISLHTYKFYRRFQIMPCGFKAIAN
ncbi:MAG: hypothetical protein PUP91_36210 [Rhizonema sp. PD37]|nr:hypothetical protein [Rhizonema sp. PD37]